MELIIGALVMAILGLSAIVGGHDSRDGRDWRRF
jgi:hypothetical protein